MTFVVHIREGEVLEQLQKAVTEGGIQHAGIHLVGGVDSFTISTISTMPAHDATQVVRAYVTEVSSRPKRTSTTD